MWLLNTDTIELTQFLDDRIAPCYAILSHTWEIEEVTLQEIQVAPRPLHITEKAGFKKVLSCCAQAATDGFEWVWIDTCCIDKTNSAELSEAINSMFRWYGNAIVCYAYLADVEIGDNPEHEDSQFQKSRWFTRGWTLQELLAPRSMVFYNRDWEDIGTKKSLEQTILSVTKIEGSYTGDTNHLSGYVSDYLPDMVQLRNVSVAQKMFWASRRETTRVEDIAYCLLGLFGISMPLIYGEGINAFKRLQLEIMKSSEDQSIFCWWQSNARTGSPLASSPMDFQLSNHITCGTNTNSDFSMTNRGLKINLPLINVDDTPIALLNCYYGGARTQLGIRLQKIENGESNDYSRVTRGERESFKTGFEILNSSIYIREFKTYQSEFSVDPSIILGFRHHHEFVPIYKNEHCEECSSTSNFEHERQLSSRKLTNYVYATHVIFDKAWTTSPIMVMFEELPEQGSEVMQWTSTSGEHFAVSVGFPGGMCWLDLLIPISDDDKNYASKSRWRRGPAKDGSDRREGLLPSSCSVKIAVRTVVNDKEPGLLLDIKSEKKFTPVLMGNACCWPVGYGDHQLEIKRQLSKESPGYPIPQIPAS
jgi:hypothetical protein